MDIYFPRDAVMKNYIEASNPYLIDKLIRLTRSSSIQAKPQHEELPASRAREVKIGIRIAISVYILRKKHVLSFPSLSNETYSQTPNS